MRPLFGGPLAAAPSSCWCDRPLLSAAQQIELFPERRPNSSAQRLSANLAKTKGEPGRPLPLIKLTKQWRRWRQLCYDATRCALANKPSSVGFDGPGLRRPRIACLGQLRSSSIQFSSGQPSLVYPDRAWRRFNSINLFA